jgi:hypothetical protein
MRTLRFLTLVLALSLALPMLAAPAFAGSGKAIIPGSYINYAASNNYVSLGTFLSNISDNTIEITVTLYYKSGSIVYEPGTSVWGTNCSSYTEATSSSDGYTMICDLESKKTASLGLTPRHFGSSTSEYIFGIIEWKNKYATDDDDVALVANANYVRTYSDSGKQSQSNHSVMINNGLPF